MSLPICSYPEDEPVLISVRTNTEVIIVPGRIVGFRYKEDKTHIYTFLTETGKLYESDSCEWTFAH